MRRDPRPLATVLLLALLAGCASTAPLPPATATGDPDREMLPDLVRKAEAALTDGRHAEAGHHYKRIVAIDPASIAARFGMAEIRLAAGDASRAQELFEGLVDHPDYGPRALQGRGLARLMLGQHRAAEDDLRKAVGRDPSLWRAWNGLAQIQDGERAWTASRGSYEKALTVVPDSPVVHNNLGFSFMMQGRVEEATRAFLTALRRQPDLKAAQANLRLALAWEGRYVDALAGVGMAQLPEVLNNLGYVAMVKGDLPVAEAYFTRAIEASPSYYRIAAENLIRLKAMRDAKTAHTAVWKE